MADKNKRVKVYLYGNAGTGGRQTTAHTLSPSTAADKGYWAAVAYISGASTMVGAQVASRVLYDVITGTEAPIAVNAVLSVLPVASPKLKVISVGQLYGTGEQIARCEDVSDEVYNLVEA